MIEFTIRENDKGQRLDRFMTKVFPALGHGQIRKALRKRDIKINGKRTEAEYVLKKDDVLRIYIKDEFLHPKKEKSYSLNLGDIKIIYEDENIMLIDKPVGLLVHEDNDGNGDTLINRIISYLIKKGEYFPENERSFCPALCNRIDRNTGGIVIAAKNAESLRIMAEKIKNREIEKIYKCLVAGRPKKSEDILTAYLLRKDNRVYISDKKTPQNRTIVTKYKIIDSFDEMSLLEVDLLTGRTHQIRAHLAYIGHPLIGDGKYGKNEINSKYNFKHQALYSNRLTFNFTSESGRLCYLNKKTFESGEPWFISEYFKLKKEHK